MLVALHKLQCVPEFSFDYFKPVFFFFGGVVGGTEATTLILLGYN